MSDPGVNIHTVRYIDVGDFRVRTAEFADNENRYAATVVARNGMEKSGGPVETANESRYIAAAFAAEAFEEST